MITSLANLRAIGGLGVGENSSIVYLLKDDFTDTVAAGSVNGTQATPKGGARTVVDTNTKLSIGGGLLSIATGGVAVTDVLRYPASARLTGKLLVIKMAYNSVNGTVRAGYYQATSGAAGTSMRFSGAKLYMTDDAGSTLPEVGTATINTLYSFGIVLRATGAFGFVKGGTEYPKWTLVYLTKSGVGASGYPGYVFYGEVYSSDYFRIPQNMITIAPLASDAFTRADGAIGLTGGGGSEEAGGNGLVWTGSTYTIASNKAVNTPTQGSDFVVDGAFTNTANWQDIDGWTVAGGFASKVVNALDSNLVNTAGPNATVGKWYIMSADFVGVALATFFLRMGSITGFVPSGTNSVKVTGRAISTAQPTIFGQAAGTCTSVDNFTVKELTLSTLFASVQVSNKDVVAEVVPTVNTATQAGLVLNLDNAATPANFVIAYRDGSNIHLDKCVAGTYTSLINTAATYSATARLIVSKDDTKYRVYYNDVLIGAEQTISDAGIISNTLHGLFSTYSGNTLDNFVVFARGTAGEYEGLLEKYTK